jgi:hypothetical protein
MAKVKLKKSVFLDWYFSDLEDYEIFAKNLVSDLKKFGKAKTSVKELVSGCGYIPGFITEKQDSKEYDPEKIKLINQ